MIRRLTLVAAFAAASLLALPALAAQCPGPDTFGHECSSTDCGALTPGSWTNLNPSNCDDCSQTRSLPFTFQFYGTPVNSVSVSSNGFLDMTAGGDNFSFSCPNPSSSNAGHVGMYNDMVPANGGIIRDGVFGSAPNRVYIVEYNGVQQGFSSGANATYQIQLHENGGAGERVDIAVQSFTGSDFPTYVGMTNNAGSDNLVISCSGNPPACTSMSTEPPPTGGGDCDLTPVLNALDAVEAKLDMNLDAPVSSRASQVSVDAVEAKLDTFGARFDALEAGFEGLSIQICDVVRLLHTPQGQRETGAVTLPDGTECGPYSWNSGATASGGE